MLTVPRRRMALLASATSSGSLAVNTSGLMGTSGVWMHSSGTLVLTAANGGTAQGAIQHRVVSPSAHPPSRTLQRVRHRRCVTRASHTNATGIARLVSRRRAQRQTQARRPVGPARCGRALLSLRPNKVHAVVALHSHSDQTKWSRSTLTPTKQSGASLLKAPEPCAPCNS
jgi:hypothetical protein